MIKELLNFNKLVLLFFLLYFAVPPYRSANVGEFYGAGSQVIPIKPTKTTNIQLNNELVYFGFKILPTPTESIFPWIPAVNLQANFELHNTLNQKKSIQFFSLC